jgi:hypothetical protein
VAASFFPFGPLVSTEDRRERLDARTSSGIADREELRWPLLEPIRGVLVRATELSGAFTGKAAHDAALLGLCSLLL